MKKLVFTQKEMISTSKRHGVYLFAGRNKQQQWVKQKTGYKAMPFSAVKILAFNFNCLITCSVRYQPCFITFNNLSRKAN